MLSVSPERHLEEEPKGVGADGRGRLETAPSWIAFGSSCYQPPALAVVAVAAVFALSPVQLAAVVVVP